MWIDKAQQIYKSAEGEEQNKLTLHYLQLNLQINNLICKCNLIYKKQYIRKKEINKK